MNKTKLGENWFKKNKRCMFEKAKRILIFARYIL